MYDFFKKVLPVAEQLGEIREVQMNKNDSIWGDRVGIEGVTPDGRAFELILTIKDGETDAQ